MQATTQVAANPRATLEILTIVAVFLSPIIPVLITLWWQHRKERRDRKLWLFNTLMMTRHAPLVEENVRALNMIDTVFHDEPSVRALWHEYFEMLNNPGLNNPEGWGRRGKKNLEMITAMAAVMGYKSSVSHLDVDRMYNPQGMADSARRAGEISDELLRVLKGSQGLNITKKD